MAYVYDKMAQDKNIEVLRLPPYHCELNPIEMIWGQVKGHVAAKNKTFKMAGLKVLLDEAISKITPAAWQRCVEHFIAIFAVGPDLLIFNIKILAELIL